MQQRCQLTTASFLRLSACQSAIYTDDYLPNIGINKHGCCQPILGTYVDRVPVTFAYTASCLCSVHVPWRECHLTRWLHEALSASSHVVLMGTVAAGAAAASDTLATLNWLSRFRAEGSSLNGAVWTSPDGAVEGSPHCHERR